MIAKRDKTKSYMSACNDFLLNFMVTFLADIPKNSYACPQLFLNYILTTVMEYAIISLVNQLPVNAG